MIKVNNGKLNILLREAELHLDNAKGLVAPFAIEEGLLQ